jgi:hypothetical protein
MSRQIETIQPIAKTTDGPGMLIKLRSIASGRDDRDIVNKVD